MGGAGVVGESFPLLPHCHYMKESESGEVYVFVCQSSPPPKPAQTGSRAAQQKMSGGQSSCRL